VSLTLRYALPEDSYYFFTLRCDPVASHMSRRRAPTWEEHKTWWDHTDNLRFVAEEEGVRIRVGTLRLSQDGVVSIIVDPAERGKGYGPLMLEALEPYAKEAGIHTMLAEIAYENVASQTAFLKAGWVPVLMERHV
jgi:RimJ/RimL family protein N-acetyltransferase